MRVLMFGWEFPPHISGGLGTACYGLTQGLVQNGIEVIFVVPKAFGEEHSLHKNLIDGSDISIDTNEELLINLPKELRYLKIRSEILPYVSPETFDEAVEKGMIEVEKETTRQKSGVKSRKFQFSGGYKGNLMQEVYQYAMVAAEVVETSQFDIIHVHDWLTFPAGIAAKEASNRPLVAHVHATEFDRSGNTVNKAVFEIEKSGLKTADKIITVSDYTKKTLVSKYGINPNKIQTVHNAVLPGKALKPKQNVKSLDEKIVTFLGRVTSQKGPLYFVEAAYKVLQKFQNVRFVMAGSGDLLKRAIERVAALKMSSNFHFTGFLQGESVNTMFAQSAVYVMPSVSEPFGISPLEAMNANVPAIISRQSGVAEVLKHAIKVDFWNTDAMANAIYGILKYPPTAKLMAIDGKKEVKRLKWNESAAKVKTIYQELINEKI